MNKLFFVLFLLPVTLLGQEKSQSFTLSGKANKLDKKVDWVYLQYKIGDEWITDSVQPKDGKYEFTGMIAEPLRGWLRVKYVPGSDGNKIPTVAARDMTSVFLEPGKIKVNSIDSFSNVQVEGSASHIEFAKLNEQAKPFARQIEVLITQYRAYAKEKDLENQARIEKEIEMVEKERGEKVYGEYVRNNPSSPIALYAIQQYAGWDIDADKVAPLYESLSDANKQYPSAAGFEESLAIAKKTGIGKIAMDFTQNDTLDHPVKLSSFKGRYVLVDFWASWCGPCRAENPNVVKVFNKYKDRNFHIIGVSLDRPGQKERWLKAIHDDKLDWTQVSDLKFWDNEVAKQYGIRAIPQNLLLDPEGKIIAKNISGDELDQKVGEAIENKKAF